MCQTILFHCLVCSKQFIGSKHKANKFCSTECYRSPVGKSLTKKGVEKSLKSTVSIAKLETAQKIYASKMDNIKKVSELESAKIEKKWFENNAKKNPNVKTLPSGLQYEVLKEGNGEKPTPTSKVTTHYHGTLTDGTVFDSSVDRNQPASLTVNGVIKGWQEALPMMNVGSKWKIYVPSALAYGSRAVGKIPANSILIFEIELLNIEK